MVVVHETDKTTPASAALPLEYASPRTPGTSPEPSRRATPGEVALVLIGILALAAGLRIARINYGSLTFDEQWHLELSTGRGSPHVRLPEDTLIPDAPA